MPVYNGARYLREAIDSILNQTFENFEFLIVDDASADQSAVLVRSYADARIRLVQNETNQGQVRSQNKGLRLSRGAYIARLDQDDSSLPTRLERQVAVLDAEPNVAMVGTWLSELDGEGRVTGMWRGRVNDHADYLFAILRDALPLWHPSMMFRRDAVMKVYGYDEKLPYCEDHDLWRRFALAKHDARVIAEPLTRYRVHAGQQTVSVAKMQSKNLRLSQERFIRAFTVEHSTLPLRLLMRCGRLLGDRFWDMCSSSVLAREYCHQLDCMLGNMRLQLEMNALQFCKLERLVRLQIAVVAGRAWRASIKRQWSASWPVYMFSLRGGLSIASSFHVWTYPIVYVFAPMLLVLRTLKRMALQSVLLKRCYELLRAQASRSHMLRLWYRQTR